MILCNPYQQAFLSFQGYMFRQDQLSGRTSRIQNCSSCYVAVQLLLTSHAEQQQQQQGNDATEHELHLGPLTTFGLVCPAVHISHEP